jgi:seryl-tRNA synthetase
MLDPKYIREHADEVRENAKNRGVSVDIDAWLALDQDRLVLLQEVEALRAKRNVVADSMKSASPEARPKLIEEGKMLKDEVAVKETGLERIDAEWKNELLRFPNLTYPGTPIGKTDEDNVELRKVGEIKQLESPKDHVALAEALDLIDFERGAKVAGAKFYFLKGKMVLLEQALTNFTLNYLVKQGYTPLTTPDLAKDEVLLGAGFNPRGPETQIYSIENTDLSLVGTAEIPVGGYHKDEVLTEADVPKKYVALSHCFRTEAGTYGRESYGLYRVHQFTKVEMFIVSTPEQSEALHQELLQIEEAIFQALEIPYRVIDICTGDLGGPAYRKYDLEAWMWGRGEGKGGWGEVTSTSNCTDYQARRLNIRVKAADGSIRYAHTLNGTAMAMSRGLIALLENHQQPDGSIRIPQALVPYCGFDTIGP